MPADILRDVTTALREFDFKPSGSGWLRKGKCPDCHQKTLYAHAEAPWVLKCGRIDNCGYEQSVRDRYAEIFEKWSERYTATDADPNAAADAYLSSARWLNLSPLRGSYTQEWYQDRERGIGTATVRFALPGGSWWERYIDQPGRFDRKAGFPFGSKYQGEVWHLPGRTIEEFAACESIWIAEGVFDAASLEQEHQPAVTPLSCSNYPSAFLARLAEACGAAKRPKLIFAYDGGKAGTEAIRDQAKRAEDDGWEVGAAQHRPDGEEDLKRDWNDLLILKRLGPEDREIYLFNGEITLARTATDKAGLLAVRNGWTSFPLVHDNRTYWAAVSMSRVQELKKDVEPEMRADPEFHAACVRQALTVKQIANCRFRILFSQSDAASEDKTYYLGVNFPHARTSIKATFTGSAIAAGSEFKKRLLTVAPGGYYTGATAQLDRILEPQTKKLKTVEAIQFTGYSHEHGAYVFGDIAVSGGRVYRINPHDHFEIGKLAIRLKSPKRILAIEFNADRLDLAWVGDIWTAYRERGIVVLAFWFASFFAGQIREESASLGFLEMWGEADTGKSTLIEFLWRLCGRTDFEGFDPNKGSPSGRARAMGNVGNLPVVLMESDRTQQPRMQVSHSRSFDWEELKPVFNGRPLRTLGVKNNDLDTFEPLFRGALIIEQNEPVTASTAIMSRIMSIRFSRDGYTARTKEAAERLEAWPMDGLSGFVVHAARREREVLDTYRTRFPEHFKTLLATEGMRQPRIAKCHAQLLAMLDALAAFVKLPDDVVGKSAAYIQRIALDRQAALNSDDPIVELFWQRVDYLDELAGDGANGVDHSLDDQLIAISLPEFEYRCASLRLEIPTNAELVKHLKTSKSRRFLEVKTVRSAVTGKTKHCWVFARSPAPSK